MSAPSGSGPRASAPVFVPAAPPGLAPTPSAVGAKPFVPGGSGGSGTTAGAKSLAPGGSGGGGAQPLPRSSSSSSITGAVHAPIFVPGGAALAGGGSRTSSVNAPAFVPGAGGSSSSSGMPPSGRQSAGGSAKPPKPSPSKQPGRGGGSRPGSQASGGAGRATTPDLPDGDDLLGMSAVASGDARDVAAQAAEMFRSLNPFNLQQPQQQAAQAQLQAQQPGGRGGRGGGGSARTSPRPSSAQGLGPPPPGFAPTTAAAAAAAAATAASSHPSAASTGGPGSISNSSSAAPPGWSVPASVPPPSHGSSSGGGRGSGGGVRDTRSSGGGGGGRGRGRRPSSSRPSGAYSAAPGRMQKAGLFMSEQLRAELQQRSYLIQAQVNPEAEGDLGVPQVVQSYHTLYPLEDMAAEAGSQALGVNSQVAKAISGVDGQAYVLRRIDPRQVIPTAELLGSAEAAVGRWEGVAYHPNLVGLREAFASEEWDGSPSLVFVHDYHPGAFTLEQAHILPTHTPQGLSRNPASEEQLWCYLVQLACALRCVHQAGLVVRPACLMPSKVLVTSAGRVRIGSLGIPEVLSDTSGYQDVPQLQREDLAALGNLMLLLACVGRGAPPSLEYLTAYFSREFCHVVAGLLASLEGSGFASWRSLLSALGDRVADELDTAAIYSDALLGEVQREADNGRLLRLLMKLCYICDRPELGGDTQWAETGDRYLLKLFRDLLFHQVDEEGAPLLDWGLAAEALNKVDAGVPEKVLLMSRDELSMLVVSYADVRRCISTCYEELRSRASSAYPQQPGGGGGGTGGGHMHRSRSRPSMQGQQQQQQQY